MSYTIYKEFRFSASHQLRGLPDDHPCARLHGHNYRVRVELNGPADAIGMVWDYGALAPFRAWLDTTVDHRHLNDLAPFTEVNPTAENLSTVLTMALWEQVAIPDGITSRVWVSETESTWAVWDPHGLTAWNAPH